jgi:hypothetical protein
MDELAGARHPVGAEQALIFGEPLDPADGAVGGAAVLGRAGLEERAERRERARAIPRDRAGEEGAADDETEGERIDETGNKIDHVRPSRRPATCCRLPAIFCRSLSIPIGRKGVGARRGELGTFVAARQADALAVSI